jgi:hypothetical protein
VEEEQAEDIAHWALPLGLDAAPAIEAQLEGPLDLNAPFIGPLLPDGGFPDLNGPLDEVQSMEISTSGLVPEISGPSVNNESEDELEPPEIVLALQATPTIFLHLELQPHKLDALSSDSDQYLAPAQPPVDALHPSGLASSNQLQVGMVVLPDSLDVDPGLMDYTINSLSKGHLRNADGIRLWAKHFAQNFEGGRVEVPICWNDFYTINLLHPERFNWIKAFMESSAWSLITKDSEKETSLTFSIPKSCPLSTPIQCIISSNMQLSDNLPGDTGIQIQVICSLGNQSADNLSEC